MSAHAPLESSAYSESWTSGSRITFRVIITISTLVALAGFIGFFGHQAGLQNGGDGNWSISVLA